jgi:glycosyltransferase involved in cell wall biosynthesis
MTGLPGCPERPSRPALVSVVVPVYNEVQVLPLLHGLLVKELARAGAGCEVIFVNDGSADGSAEVLDGLAAFDPRVRVLHLARNFGHQAAVQAGLLHAAGDAVVVMDADLQDDPARIPDLVAEWRKGFDIVYAVRTGRKENPVKRFLFAAFYRLLGLIASTPIPRDAGNFSLLDRRVAREIGQLADRDRYFPGLRSWVGFRQTGVVIERKGRYDGRPRVPVRGLFRLAQTAIFSFSKVPLSLFYAVSGLALVSGIGLGGFALYHKLRTGQAIPGWTSLLVSTCFFGALNALGIAVLGEYVLRIYDQARARPLFIVARTVNVPAEAPDERPVRNASQSA